MVDPEDPPARPAELGGGALLLGALLGASLVGVLDLLWLWPGATPAGLREPGMVILGGNVLVALCVALVHGLLARRWRRLQPRAGAGLSMGVLLGLALGAGPLLGHLAGTARAGMAFVLAATPLCWWLGRHLPDLPVPAGRRGRPGWWLLAMSALPLGLPLALALLPPSLHARLPAPASAAPTAAAGSAPARGPDVVLVSIDTMRGDRLDPARSPGLFAMTARGRWSDGALAPADMTQPGHVSMLSGLSVQRHRVLSNEELMDPDIPLIQERFRAAGWRTAAVVSNWVIRGEAGFERGFEAFDESAVVSGGPVERLRVALSRHSWFGWLHGTRWMPGAIERVVYGQELGGIEGHRGNARHSVERALSLLEQLLQQDQPYFLFVHAMDPHTPYCPPDAGGDFATWDRVQGMEDAMRQGRSAEEVGVAEAAELYDAEVRFVDRMLQGLWRRIEAGGRDTVLLVTSDHGEQFGEHGLMTHGNGLYEPNLRVPLILLGPGITPGPFEAPPLLEDVAVTLLACAGLSAEGLDGVDLRDPVPQRTAVAMRGPLVAIREGPWKLIARQDSVDDERPRALRLFDLSQDPQELDDRRRSERELVERLLDRAAEARVDPGQYRSSLDPSELDRQTLRALGYLIDEPPGDDDARDGANRGSAKQD